MRPTRSKSLIYDLYGAYIRPLGGWVAVADLVALMGQLGVDEQAVRSSVSRLSRRGMLVRRRRGGQVGYQLGPEASAMLAQGDVAIFSGMRPAELADGWVLVAFSVPERQRGRRHQLRSELTWLGFGKLGSGLWIAPRRVLPLAVETVRRLRLDPYVDVFSAEYRAFEPLADLVRRCWDLDGLGAMYAAFVRDARPVLARWRSDPDGGDRQAFVDYTTVLHAWRKMPYLDPGLPRELLPAGWQGQVAARLFSEIVEHLEKRARRHVEQVMGDRRRRAAAGAAVTPAAAAARAPQPGR